MLVFNIRLRQRKIPLCHGQAGMSHQLLQSKHIATGTQKLDGEGMAERMGQAARGGDTGGFTRPFDQLQQSIGCQGISRLLVASCGKEKSLGVVRPRAKIRRQCFHGRLTEMKRALFPAFFHHSATPPIKSRSHIRKPQSSDARIPVSRSRKSMALSRKGFVERSAAVKSRSICSAEDGAMCEAGQRGFSNFLIGEASISSSSTNHLKKP